MRQILSPFNVCFIYNYLHITCMYVCIYVCMYVYVYDIMLFRYGLIRKPAMLR